VIAEKGRNNKSSDRKQIKWKLIMNKEGENHKCEAAKNRFDK
jgi:hypothetical protein